MSLSSNLPTNQPDHPPTYYQYRLTVPHSEQATFDELIKLYSSDYCYVLHTPDQLDPKEHYHAVFFDLDKAKIEAFRKRFANHWQQYGSGNALYAGKNCLNHVSEAIAYFKHESGAPIHHSGQAYWAKYVADTPAFVKGQPPCKKARVFKESMSYPVLTYANVLKQAFKYRNEHAPECIELSEVVKHMVNVHNWWPSRELLTNGIPTETHQRFSDMVSKKSSKLDFWLPHERSEKKLEWTDRVATGWYPSGVSSSGPPSTKLGSI